MRYRYSTKLLQAGLYGMVHPHPPSQLKALFVQPRRPRVFACFARHVPEACEFAKLKALVRKAQARTLKVLIEAMGWELEALTVSDARSFFKRLV